MTFDAIEPIKRENYDVIVVGGGIAGIAAAVSAAREGMKTFLIEKSFNLGGLATGGLISWYEPLCDGKGNQMIFGIAEELKDSIPCTACRYCTDGCPAGLDIPLLIANYNELRFVPSVNTSMRLDALPDDKLPTACISCGKCTQICPQKINIPDVMRAFAEKLTTITKWSDVCAAREKAQK